MATNQKMFAAYCRVSTYDQNTTAQKKEIKRWLDGHSIDCTGVRWFIDKGATGKNLQRPEFERMQQDIFSGEIGTVLCFRLDRLSRSIRDGVITITDWIERDIRVVSVTEQIDFGGPTGKIIAAVLLGIAEMELAALKERQKHGIQLAKARGVYKGRKPGTLKGKPQRAYDLQQSGLTYKEIQNAMGVGRATVIRYLRQARDECEETTTKKERSTTS